MALAFPVVAGQVGQMLMGWVDTVMIGRIGVAPLAACALANTVVAVFMVCGFGLLSAISVRASHAYGRGDMLRTASVMRSGNLLAWFAGAGAALLILGCLPLLPHLGQSDEVVELTGPYLALLGVSVVPMFVLTASRNFSEALERPWPPFWILVGSVLLNALLNAVFIYGMFGVPAMGLMGAGLATLLARVAGALAMWGYVRGNAGYRPFLARGNRRLVFPEMRVQLHLGWPIGLQLFCEIGAFAFASLMLGWIGATELAAHQIAITCAATTFMVPLGISMAITVRIGHAVGRSEPHRVRPLALGAYLLGIAVMGASCVVFLMFRNAIPQLFIDDPGVIAVAAQLLVVAGIFQIFDGMQVVGIGCLRGLADVRVPMLMLLGTYWVLALPLAAVLAFAAELGAVGVWIGLAVGLAVVALLVGWRFALFSRGTGETGARTGA